MTDAIAQILDHYRGQPPGVLANLARILNHGKLGGTGKLVILPVDQGVEHGPARSFAENPVGYDPDAHVELALAAGCNAYAAPLGFLEAIAATHAGEVPLILKANNHDSMTPDGDDPIPSVTSTVQDALRLGCSAVGFTMYPGSARIKTMVEEFRALAAEAKAAGLAVVAWSYPRGSGLSKEGETAIDVVSYAAQIAAQLGAHIIKVKLPSARIEREKAQKVFDQHDIPVDSVADRVRHVMRSAFDGKRIVIFSGGSKTSEEAFYRDIQGIHDGGGFGSIIGRNSFQRPKDDAVRFLGNVMEIYRGERTAA